MAENEAPKQVEVTLSQPQTTNEAIYGYEIDGKPVVLHVGVNLPRGKQAVFTGRALVSPEIAEDLERRQAEWKAYEASLNSNHGKEVPVFA